MNETLMSLGFKRRVADPCLYTRGTGDRYLLLLVFVNDLLAKGITQRGKGEEKRIVSSFSNFALVTGV